MRILGSPKTMQRQALQWRREGLRVGFVPTMGYLHEGHLSLVREARRRVGAGGIVVLSIYVNPTQFAPTEDLAKYPRNFERDCRMCREAGVDMVFAPTDRDMYPGREVGDYTTYVVEEGLTQRLEGASRPTHFRGVTTVVAKLFHCVLPEVSVFGAKDWQQAAVVQRMVRDLEVIHYAVSLGHHRSLIYWIGTDDIQASTFRHDAEQLRRYRAFAGDGVFRLSVGIENADDLIADLAKVL